LSKILVSGQVSNAGQEARALIRLCVCILPLKVEPGVSLYSQELLLDRFMLAEGIKVDQIH